MNSVVHVLISVTQFFSSTQLVTSSLDPPKAELLAMVLVTNPSNYASIVAVRSRNSLHPPLPPLTPHPKRQYDFPNAMSPVQNFSIVSKTSKVPRIGKLEGRLVPISV